MNVPLTLHDDRARSERNEDARLNGTSDPLAAGRGAVRGAPRIASVGSGMGLTVGLPRMTAFPGERRDFLPPLVRAIERCSVDEVVLERGYGEGVGAAPDDYLRGSRCVRFADHDESLRQSVVLVLRCPPEADLDVLRPGALLVSMLHFATRPGRIAHLRERGIHGLSLDSVLDDAGRRLVHNMELVGWAGVGAAFERMATRHPDFAHPGRPPIRVTVLGSGAVGTAAVHVAAVYGDPTVRADLHAQGVPGVEVVVVDFDLSIVESYMRDRLGVTDLLIDAAHRRDPSVPSVPNVWIEVMPDHAVLLDLAADPYDLSREPPAVKGLEGVPHGTLERFLFEPDDPAWELVGPPVDTTNRRTALSCDAWPGVRPRESMSIYGEQLEDVMDVVLSAPPDAWDSRSGHHAERAVARGELERWLRAR